jgi:hypothetical protein
MVINGEVFGKVKTESLARDRGEISGKADQCMRLSVTSSPIWCMMRLRRTRHGSRLTLRRAPQRSGSVIQDNGKGMDARALAKAKDPFYSEPANTPTQCGVGHSLLMQSASAVKGTVDIGRRRARGPAWPSRSTRVFWTPALRANLHGTLLGLLTFRGPYDLILTSRHADPTDTRSRAGS